MRRNTEHRHAFFPVVCFVAASVFLFVGCSKSDEKDPEKEKPVVRDMNIPKSDSQKPKPEVETLPFESGEDKQEELPTLGSPD